jgi:hypothetical protein
MNGLWEWKKDPSTLSLEDKKNLECCDTQKFQKLRLIILF